MRRCGVSRLANDTGSSPSAGAQRSIYFEATHTPAGWLSDWTTTRVPFPIFAVSGAERDIGAIAFQGGEDMVAYPDAVEGLTPLDDRDKADYGLSAAAGFRDVPAFRYDRRPYQAIFRIERIPPRLTASVYSFFELDPDLLSASYEVVFNVDRAKADTLVLSLPAGTSAELTIASLSGTAVKEYESALAGERRRWTVHLAEPRRDGVRLAVNLEQTLDCSQPVDLTLPMLRAEGVAHQSGVVAVEGSAELDIQAMSALRKVDVGELAGATHRPRRGAAGGLDVFAYVGDDPAINVRMARHPAYELPHAIVRRAEMMTQVSANGIAQTAVRLHLRTTAAFLEIELPTASSLWSARIDDKPMSPQREGERLLLSLPAADRPLDVWIVYESPIEPVGLWSDVTLAPPRFSVRGDEPDARPVDVPAADLQWNVALPTGFRFADYAGTVATRYRVSPTPATWRVARWLWLGTGGIHPFYGSCLPSLSRARELSRRIDREVKVSRLDLAEGTFAADSTAAREGQPASQARRLMRRRGQLPAAAGGDRPAAEEPAVPGTVAADVDDLSALGYAGAAETEHDLRLGYDRSLVPGVAPEAGEDAAAPSLWALEGVRSLKIDLEPSGHVIVFTSLGADPKLQLTLANESRVTALGWGLALAAALVGLVLTTRPARIKVLYVATVAIVTTALPMVMGSTELVYVTNPMFYAVSLLVPFYVVVRLVTWLTVHVRRPGWFRAPKAATSAMLALMLGLATTVRAEPPSAKGTQDDPVVVRIVEPLRPIEVPDDAVIVPYDPSAALGADGAPRPGSQVLIPYAKYQALWKIAHPEAQPTSDTAPARYAFTGGAFTATLQEGDYLDLEGHWEMMVYTDAHVAVPLVLSDAILTAAKLDGHPAPFSWSIANPDRKSTDASPLSLMLQLKGKGSHRLDLGVRVRLTREGGWRVARGRIPSPPGTALTLHIPSAGTDVRLDAVDDRRLVETTTPDETITTALGPAGVLHVRWRPRVREGLGESSLTATSDALLDVREDGMRLVWKLTVDSGRSERDSHRLLLPPDYAIYAIRGPNVRGWNAVEGDRREVMVSLLQPSKGREDVTVVLHQQRSLTRTDRTTIDVPVVHVVGASLQDGRLTIRRSSALQLTTAFTSGATRLDISNQADSLAALSPDASDSPLGMTVYQSYRFASLPLVIQLDAKPQDVHLSAQLQTILRIGERRRTLETRVNISAGPQPVHRVRVGIPDDLKDEHVEAPGAFEWAVTGNGPKTLTVYLTVGQKASFPIIIRGTLGEEGPVEQIELPRFHLLGAEGQSGQVAVQIDPALDLRVDPIKDCREIPLENVYGWLTPPQRPLLRMALRHSGDRYEASLRVTARRPEVTCTTVSNVRVTPSTIEETILLDFTVAEAGVREISFLLPEGMKDSRISVPMLRAKTFEPVADEPGSPVRVRLALQDEIMGRIRVLIENDRSLTADAFRAPLPVVETGRTDRRYVALESAGRDEVTVESQIDLEPLTHSQSEWRTLTDLLGATLTQAYVATGEDPVLSLRTSERTAVETTGARIGLARTVLVADAGGAYRAIQSYRIDNRTEPFLEVLLPDGAGLWSVQVAGKPVKPAGTTVTGTDRQVRIPLIKSAAGDLDYEVVLKYAGRLAPFGVLREADFPLPRATNITAELSQVSLWLPEDYLWFDLGGTMRQVVDEAELVAGYVRYQTRLTERLGQTLESNSPFARARASANLKEAEYQIEQLRGIASTRRGNTALDAELKSSEQVVARAQAQQQRQQKQQRAQAGTVMDNRQTLASTFEKQQVARARNQVQDDFYNFAAVPESPPQGQKQGRVAFDPTWLDSSKLGDRGDAVPESRQQALARVETDDSLMRQQQAARVQPQAPQFGPQGAKGRKGQVDAVQRLYSAKSQRAAGTEELAFQYQQQLEHTGPESAAAPAPAATPARGFLGRDPGALPGWTVDLPLRGRAFHFTTPRGEVSVTARSVSRDFIRHGGRLGLTALAVLAFALACRLATRFRVPEEIGKTGATAMIVLGTLSVLTGVLPVVGVLVVVAGWTARRKIGQRHPATPG